MYCSFISFCTVARPLHIHQKGVDSCLPVGLLLVYINIPI